MTDEDLAAAIAVARSNQLSAAAEIAGGVWNERGAVLGLADWFAEEFLLTQGNNDIRRQCRECRNEH